MRKDLLHKLKKHQKNDPHRKEVLRQKSRMAKFVEIEKKLKWVAERKFRAEIKSEKKMAKETVKEFFKIRKCQPPSPEICPLYSCTRSHLHKRNGHVGPRERPRERNRGSPISVKSHVSNQSRRSRSPIKFRISD